MVTDISHVICDKSHVVNDTVGTNSVRKHIKESMDTYTFMDSDLKERTMKVTPNKILVRKCERRSEDFCIGEATEEGVALGNLYLDELTKNSDVNWCEVLAVGARRPWNVRQRRILKVAKHFWPDVKVGAFVALPEVSTHNRMWARVINDYDIIVDAHECLVGCEE